MFKQSRVKIVAAIMSILAVLFLGTLAVIYGSSYFEVSSSNYEMLKRYVELYSLDEMPGEDGVLEMAGLLPEKDMSPVTNISPEKKVLLKEGMPSDMNIPKIEPQEPHFEDTPAFQLSTFYSVAISNDGEVLAIDNGNESVYDDESLETYAFEIVEMQNKKGVIENLIYLTADKGDYTLAAFMDNTIMQESMTTLFRYTLVFGSVTMVALFFLAAYLAKRIVDPLEESYQKQKQFISDAGHELKTPIAVVSTNAELLSREIGENQWLANIRYENERMGRLVGQLLELARTENVEAQTQRLDFSHLVSGEALPFESVAYEKGLLLNCDIQENLYVDGNSNQLKQLVAILLDNALRHGSEGKEVSLQVSEERNTVKLTVVNTGEEIPLQQRELLFERFYRVDEARNSEEKHYGLGLAIAKAIVTAHKGKISVICYDGKVEFAVRMPLQK